MTAEPNVPTPIEEPLPTFDYTKEQAQLNTLIQAWDAEKRNSGKRREIRENKKSVEEERQKKTILEDETIIPDRTVNSNIRRSKVPYSSYVTQSKRLLVITSVTKPAISLEDLELWFTRGMRFPGWKDTWFELIDSMHVHGGAALEVVYDPSKPLNVSLEYIPREHLIMPLKTKNLQNCPRIIRVYEVTPIQLEQFIEEYEFNPAVARPLFEKFHKQDDTIEIYRVLMKSKGVVYNAWYAKDGASDWLRAPRPHDIGLFDFDPDVITQNVMVPTPTPVPMMSPTGMGMTMGMQMQDVPMPLCFSPQWEQAREQFMKPLQLRAYPIVWFPFQKVENQQLLQVQGRVSLDLHVQEAMTCTLTDTVNSAHRAAGFYPYAKNMPGDDPKMMELGPLKHGVIMSRELGLNTVPWPNPIVIPIMQALKIGKADESGQMDYATVARKDANKTAKEMELAVDQSNMVITSDMDVFSSPFLSTYALCYNVACHQAIFLLCTPPPHPVELLGDYNLQPAGDIEVVKRQEDKQNAKEFFNIVAQGNPLLAEKLLVFLIKRFFPDQADEWISVLQSPDARPMLAQMTNIVSNIPLDALPPEQRSALGNIVAAARQLVGTSSNMPAIGMPGSQQEGNPGPSDANEQANGD